MSIDKSKFITKIFGSSPHHQKTEFECYTGLNFKVFITIHKKILRIDRRGPPYILTPKPPIV